MPEQSFQFVSFLKVVPFPLHCTHIFLISFPRLTKNIDFGHKRVLSREVRGLFFFFFLFFFLLILSALKCHLSCLLFWALNKRKMIYGQQASLQRWHKWRPPASEWNCSMKCFFPLGWPFNQVQANFKYVTQEPLIVFMVFPN